VLSRRAQPRICVCVSEAWFAVGVPLPLLVVATDRELCPVNGARTLCCGIGPVEATLMTARALAEEKPSALLHVGIAGATHLEPGTVVIGSKSIYCDVLDPRSTLPRIAELKPSRMLVDLAQIALPDAVTAPIATAARVGGGAGYPVEAMEGFGVLRAAAASRVSAVEIRVISNNPADTDRQRWRIEDALAVVHRVIRTVVPAMTWRHPQTAVRCCPQVRRLWRRPTRPLGVGR
jgi:futalosine hydrolase